MNMKFSKHQYEKLISELKANASLVQQQLHDRMSEISSSLNNLIDKVYYSENITYGDRKLFDSLGTHGLYSASPEYNKVEDRLIRFNEGLYLIETSESYDGIFITYEEYEKLEDMRFIMNKVMEDKS